MEPRHYQRLPAAALLTVMIFGCGTTRTTDSPRAATEMLLISQAADNAVAQIDFTPLAGKAVFLDSSGIDNAVVDKGYLVSLIRQQLLGAGALVHDEKVRSDYVVELRAGGLGTDRHSLLVGTPAVALPSVLPGLPTNIPEIALIKRNDQRGVAKIAVFAYNRLTGRAMWQSGTVEAQSRAGDTWVFGAGPISRGSIRRRTELAGEPLPTIPTNLLGGKPAETPIGPFGEQFFPNYQAPAEPRVIPAGLSGVIGAPALVNKPLAR